MASNQETQKNLYYEDVSIGQEVCTDSHTVTEKDILMFAEVTRDCHPLHTDPEYCKKTKLQCMGQSLTNIDFMQEMS